MIIQEFLDTHARLAIIIFVSLIAIGLIGSISTQRTSGDFDVYYTASQNYLARASIYIPHGGGIEEFKYLPFFALAFSSFTLLGKTTALYIWSILNILLLYSMFYFLYRLKLIAFTRAKDFWLIFLLFALTGRYIFSSIKIGQVNILLCFLLLLVMYFQIRKEDFWAAFFLALSLMIKLFPLLFLVYFVMRKRLKLAGYTILLSGAFLLLPTVYSGFNLNIQYLCEWVNLLESTSPGIIYAVKNYSLLSCFAWFFIVKHQDVFVLNHHFISKALTTPVYYAWIASACILFGLFFYDTFLKKDKDPEQVYMDYSCLLVCGLLLNPLAYLNSLVILIIPYFFILRYPIYLETNKNIMGLVWLLVVSSFILMMVNNKIFFFNIDNFYQLLKYKLPTWTMLLVYFNLLLIKVLLKRKQNEAI